MDQKSGKKKLTAEEKAVIVGKRTEPPFSGEYNDFYKEGIYACRKCGNRLFDSSAKFKSGCGWSSFDDEFPGSVVRVLDADGRRMEIVCANCRGHLGHVFLNEELTEKNTRHCVNSLALKFMPKERDASDKDSYLRLWVLLGIFEVVLENLN